MSGFQRILGMSGGAMTIGVLAAAVATTASLPAAAVSHAPLSKPQARTVAKHINLRQTDFPGYTAHPHHRSKGGTALAKEYAACRGVVPKVAEVTSPAFAGNGVGFYSVTRFVASRAAAQHDSQLAVSEQARDCLKRELKEIATAIGASDAQVTLTPVAEGPVKGIDAISAIQITVDWTAYGFHGTLHGWVVNFQRGNAEVTLDELGTTNVAQSAVQVPLSHLIARAKHRVPAGGLAIRRS